MASVSSRASVVLKSNEGDEFEISMEEARMSTFIEGVVAECREDDKEPLMLPMVKTDTLSKVVQYCKRHAPHAAVAAEEEEAGDEREKELKEWDAEYMKDVDTDGLYHLMMAANYLHIDGLLNLTVETTANLIKGKTPEKIRETFKIENDFTPEEEEAIRKEHSWAFES